jgi:uncharacterized protein
VQGAAGAGKQAQRDPNAPPPAPDRHTKFANFMMNNTTKIWKEVFAASNQKYVEPKMVVFSEQVVTGGCGTAPSAVGPFYCPADQTVYLDPVFFDELEQKLGGSKKDFSQAYVIGHEVGHHVQKLLGFSDLVNEKRRTAEENQYSVRLELQADYLAGVWAHYAQKKEPGLISESDIDAAITSAKAIGDDVLQKRSGGFVSPEGFTHGTAAQRVKYFRAGLQSGNLDNIDKFFKLPYNQL